MRPGGESFWDSISIFSVSDRFTPPCSLVTFVRMSRTSRKVYNRAKGKIIEIIISIDELISIISLPSNLKNFAKKNRFDRHGSHSLVCSELQFARFE